MLEGENVQTQDENVDPVEETTEGQGAPEQNDENTDGDNSEQDQTAQPTTQAQDLKPVERSVYTMPVQKAQEEKRRAVEKARQEVLEQGEVERKRLETEYEEKLRKAQPVDLNDPVQAFAKENDLDQSIISGLAKAIESKVSPNTSRVENFIREQEVNKEKLQVAQEFDEKVLPIIQADYPGVTVEHIQEVKKRISDLAFSEGYNRYRIEDIYKVRKQDFEFKNGMTAESSSGRSDIIAPFKKLSDDQENELADTDIEGYKSYVKWLSSQESQYIKK